ncbi:virulence RhuM family protein [Neisseria weaveri]|uniref:virulence RhuM family protein n=1 Tax=Neisseria weaveri TaxID=28091 RepID=UPI000D313C71|nr:virulence RhuM family protein [Neisseria weaveri]
MTQDVQVSQGEFLLYQTEDAQTRIQVRFVEGGLWLSQAQMAELFQVSVRTISEHLGNIFDEDEVDPERTIRKFRIVQIEGSRQVRRLIDHYHLDAVLAVGYRVRSHRGMQFRRWATEQLGHYLEKGFLLDSERFKAGKDEAYFEALLAQIRDIRSSEKVFWRKVLDIYATSIDYDPNTETSRQFFATLQNKMHWAAHGHTAAELIMLRADAEAPYMGLTNWDGQGKGKPVRKADVGIAKNYLNAEELEVLNRIVTAYIEVAELQAQARQPMYMTDWANELDNFLRLTRKEVLTHAGKVSADAALARAQAVYEQYRAQQNRLPSRAEQDFERAIGEPVKQLERARKQVQPKNKDKKNET